jgi:hypothetical protein
VSCLVATAMNFGDWVSAALNMLQIAAIVIAAAWAYYKFVRGRTFHRRAEVDVDASLLADDSERAIHAHATLQNTGGADIPLRVKALKVRSFRRGEVDEKGRPRWQDVTTSPVFDDHDWIESQETIADEVLVPLTAKDANGDVLAYRVTCLIYEQRRKKFFRREAGGGVCWTSNAIVPADLAPLGTKEPVKSETERTP